MNLMLQREGVYSSLCLGEVLEGSRHTWARRLGNSTADASEFDGTAGDADKVRNGDPSATCAERAQKFVAISALSYAATRWGLFFAGLFLGYCGPKISNSLSLGAVIFGLCLVCRGVRLSAPLSTPIQPPTIFAFLSSASAILSNQPFIGSMLSSSDGVFSAFEGLVHSTLGLSQLETAFSLLGFAGTCLYSSSLHCANLFPTKRKLSTSIIAGAVNMSAMVFIFLEDVHSRRLLGFTDLITLQAVLTAFCLLLSFVLMPWKSYMPPSPPSSRLQSKADNNKTTSNTDTTTLHSNADSDGKSRSQRRPKQTTSTGGGESSPPVEADDKGTPCETPVAPPSVLSSLLSVNFAALTTSFSVCFLCANFYLATFQDRLAELGDEGNVIGKWCTILAPIGPFLSPVFGMMMEVFGTRVTAVSLYCILVGMCIATSIPSLAIQVFGAICYAIVRPLASSLQLAQFSECFGAGNLMMTYGMAAPVYGLATSRLAPPLRTWAYSNSLAAAYRMLAGTTVICFMSVYILRPEEKSRVAVADKDKNS